MVSLHLAFPCFHTSFNLGPLGKRFFPPKSSNLRGKQMYISMANNWRGKVFLFSGRRMWIYSHRIDSICPFDGVGKERFFSAAPNKKEHWIEAKKKVRERERERGLRKVQSVVWSVDLISRKTGYYKV